MFSVVIFSWWSSEVKLRLLLPGFPTTEQLIGKKITRAMKGLLLQQSSQ